VFLSSLAARIRALCALKKDAQDGRGVKRPPEELRIVSVLTVARIRALCALKKHAQDGRGVKRPPEELRIVSVLTVARIRALCALLVVCVSCVAAQSSVAPPRAPGQNPNGMHVYIWAGLKSHQPGQHDYPQFLADWSKILTEHGAVVDGGLHPPSPEQLAQTDVVVIYKGDAGYLVDRDKAAFEAYVKRGGGFVNLHDSLCGPDPAYMASLLGGGKKHGEVNYTLDAPIHYAVTDAADPIMKDMSDITIMDEAFYNMTWANNPAIHVLANVTIPATKSAGDHKGEVVPQIWTYEHTVAGGEPARAFVWMQGHIYANFSNYQLQRMLLRGIAWAGKKPADELVNYVPPARPASAGAPVRTP
jgi:type 1 glutamine amidotransferase